MTFSECCYASGVTGRVSGVTGRVNDVTVRVNGVTGRVSGVTGSESALRCAFGLSLSGGALTVTTRFRLIGNPPAPLNVLITYQSMTVCFSL